MNSGKITSLLAHSSEPDSGADSITAHCKGCKKEDLKKIKIRSSLFFDGTGNNRTNVGLGKGGATLIGKDSYLAAESNVSRLEKLWTRDKVADHSFSIYVEGIGTQDRGRDIPEGVVLGTGLTGVMAKVESGIEKLVSRIGKLEGGVKNIEYLHLDVFGFSRGAAAARNFVYATLQNPGDTLRVKLTAKGFTVGKIEVKFMGLFDTVASYGIEHKNDTSDLNLDAVKKAARVVQLAASEEHRKNFRLTNIASAKKNGLQIFLPGVHSDVGGGYNETGDATEENLQILDLDRAFRLSKADKAALEREQKWLLQSGWYSKEEINGVDFTNELTVTRRGISNRYSYVPLLLMSRLAGETGVRFSPRIETTYKVPEELRDVRKVIDGYVAGVSGGWESNADDWFELNSQMMKDLRHRYLHFSAFFGSIAGANEPQFTNDDAVNGRRKRIIQDD